MLRLSPRFRLLRMKARSMIECHVTSFLATNNALLRQRQRGKQRRHHANVHRLLLWLLIVALGASGCVLPHFPIQLTSIVDNHDLSTTPHLELIGHVGGTAVSIAVRDEYAYLGFSHEWVVLDISDRSNPQWVAALPVPASDIALDEQYAYVVGRDGFHVIDIAVPTQPRQVGMIATNAPLSDIAVANHHAYAISYGDLYVIDITSPVAPRQVGHGRFSARFDGITVKGNYAYVAGMNGLYVIEVSDPVQLIEVSLLEGDSDGRVSVVANNYLYFGGRELLQVMAIFAPERPQPVAQIAVPGFLADLGIADNIAYIANGAKGVSVWDLEDIAAPIPLGNYATSTLALALAVADGYVYVVDCDEGLQIYDAADPTHLVKVGSFVPIGVTPNPMSSYAFVDVNVVTMETDAILPHQTVVVAEQHIVALGPVDAVPVPAAATRIDGAGKYLMPGLADMHIHLKQQTYLPLLLLNGVTTVRNMDGAPEHLLWRRMIADGKLLGPTIFTTGPAIDEFPAYVPNQQQQAATWEGALALVAEQKRLGYDYIKVLDGVSISAYHNLIAAAQRYHMPVVGHVPNTMPIMDVIRAGQRSIEHLDGYFSLYDEDLPTLISATVASGVWNCPTLVVCRELQCVDQSMSELQHTNCAAIDLLDLDFWFLPRDFDELAYRYAAVDQLRLAMVQRLHSAGAPLLLGTDAPIPNALPGYAVHQELQYLVDAGLSPYEALRTATYNAAQFVEQLDQCGTIAVGKRADLVLLTTNPLADITNTRAIEGVMAQGRWLSQPALLQLLAMAAPDNVPSSGD